MTTLREAAQQALEALEKQVRMSDGWTSHAESQAITSLRTALAEPEQEPLGYWNAVEGWVELPEAEQPVAWVYPEGLEALQQGKPWTAYGSNGNGPHRDGVERIPLYTHPPQRKPLTDDQAMAVWDNWCRDKKGGPFDLIRAIERAHGIGGEA
jgi:hypothetical protein